MFGNMVIRILFALSSVNCEYQVPFGSLDVFSTLFGFQGISILLWCIRHHQQSQQVALHHSEITLDPLRPRQAHLKSQLLALSLDQRC